VKSERCALSAEPRTRALIIQRGGGDGGSRSSGECVSGSSDSIGLPRRAPCSSRPQPRRSTPGLLWQQQQQRRRRRLLTLRTTTTIFRPHRGTTQMRTIATDGVVWSVCLSIGLSVTTVSPAKTADLIEMTFEIWSGLWWAQGSM